METKQKTVTIEIPEGKKTVWNEQGILQLVDDDKESNEPKPVTERIKTFYDAYSELMQMANHNFLPAQKLIEEYDAVRRMGMSDDIVAYMQLRIITAALNEDWKPTFKEGEMRWYPYLILWSKDEIDNMSDEEKDYRQLLQWDYSAYGGRICGSSCSISYVRWKRAGASVSSRLSYKTPDLAMYAGHQFASIYARYFIGDKAIGALPWREFEQKHKSSVNK